MYLIQSTNSGDNCVQPFSELSSFLFDKLRLSDLNVAFANKRDKESEWPFSLPDPKDLFRQFRRTLHSFSHDITGGCCVCVFHDPTVVRSVSLDYAPLSLLKVDPTPPRRSNNDTWEWIQLRLAIEMALEPPRNYCMSSTLTVNPP